MKKQIVTGIAIIACVALCAAVWPRNAEVEDLLAELIKPAVVAEIKARLEKTPEILLSADTHTLEPETVAEYEPERVDITTEKETPIPTLAQETKVQEVSPTSAEPRMGDVRIINGEKQIYIDGFSWIKDEGGGSQGTTVGNPGDELTGNKVGQMGGGVTVHGKGDINKQVGVMGGGDAPPSNSDSVPGTKKYIDGTLRGKPSVGIVADDMYENGNKIGSMGDGESPPRETTTPATEQLEPIDGKIHIVFVEVSEKNSTPPPYKPDTVSP